MAQKKQDKSLYFVSALALIFIVVALAVSVKAAALIVLMLAGLAILAGVIWIVVLGRQLRRAAVEFGQSLQGLASAISLNLTLEPHPGPPPRNQDILRGLADELLQQGFTWAGFYQVSHQDVYVLGLAHPELKAYALITDFGEFTPPFAELSSFYEDGGAYCLTANPNPDFLPRPDNMVQIERPGLRPAELLPIFLQERPGSGLLETPPHGLARMVAWENDRIKEFIAAQADDEAEEPDGEEEDR